MSNQISNIKSNNNNNEEITMTNNNNQAPAVLPLTHVHAEVDCASEGYDGEYSSRYISEETRQKLEIACEDATDETEAHEAQQEILAAVHDQSDTFWGQLDGEPNDSFDGVETGWTESKEGLTRFAKENEGLTLNQLLTGVRYEGGFVNVDFDSLINSERFEEEFVGNIDECWKAAEAAADRYVLQADATLVLAA